MRRVSICPRTGLKRGAWTKEEDVRLSTYIKRYGHSNWRELPKYAGLSRCGKSCRLRWMNYLRPNIKRGNYTKTDEEIILRMHQKVGNRWSVIAGCLPGRTDNEIKNHWHTHLKRRKSHCPKSKEQIMKAEKSHCPKSTEQIMKAENCETPRENIVKPCVLESSDILPVPALAASDSSSLSSNYESKVNKRERDGEVYESNKDIKIEPSMVEDSYLLSTSCSKDAETDETDQYAKTEISSDVECSTDFWSELFSVGYSFKSTDSGSGNEVTRNESQMPSDSAVYGFDGNFWNEPFLVEDAIASKDNASFLFSYYTPGEYLYDVYAMDFMFNH